MKKNLDNARKIKKDEFYTMYSDVEKELQHYKRHFKDKVVYCNCDTTNSAFWKYFYNNFENFGLKRLISTYYSPDFNAYKTEYCGGEETREKLQWNGDVRSSECQELMDECDIVCTNPPFSLFREYFGQLIEHGKHFLIIGATPALIYKGVFPLLKNNEVLTGYTKPKEFWQADGSVKKFGNIIWFTNLDIQKKHEKIILWKEYNNVDFPKYDNFDAIEVPRITDIPRDYDGIMAVPISYLCVHNPEQFEVIGTTASWDNLRTKVYPKQKQISADGSESYVTKLNDGPALEVKKAPENRVYYVVDGKMYVKNFTRVLIRRKQWIEKN